MAEELFWFVQSRHQHQPSVPIHTHLEVTAGSQSQGFQQDGDSADQLVLARAASHGAMPVLTFDQGFAKNKGVKLIGPLSSGPAADPATP